MRLSQLGVVLVRPAKQAGDLGLILIAVVLAVEIRDRLNAADAAPSEKSSICFSKSESMTPSLTACLSTFEIRNCFADSAD